MTLATDATRILVVDDSALYRQSIQNVLREIDAVEVVGWAKDGVEALAKIEQLNPDLLTLDVQMPDMDGIQVLREVKRRRLRVKAIMVSSLTATGAQVTTDALLEGAFDFILKPYGSDSAANRQQLRDALDEKITAFRSSGRRQLRVEQAVSSEETDDTVPAPRSACQAVILASSTGGPEALKIVLPKLPADFPLPVFVVQHMPPQYTQSLAARLNDICELEVVEASNKIETCRGRIILAAGGRQMKVEQRGGKVRVLVNDDPPMNGVRPAADYLLQSASEVFGGNALAVVMTGMGKDGLEGCRQLKEAGGFVFAQSQQDCIVYGMPKAVIQNDLADRVLPLGRIAPAIVRHVKRSQRF